MKTSKNMNLQQNTYYNKTSEKGSSAKEILGELKKLFLKFSRRIGGNTKIEECFSLSNDRKVEQFYQMAFTFCTSIATLQNFFSAVFHGSSFVIC